jgi:hypothetical protein
MGKWHLRIEKVLLVEFLYLLCIGGDRFHGSKAITGRKAIPLDDKE